MKEPSYLILKSNWEALVKEVEKKIMEEHLKQLNTDLGKANFFVFTNFEPNKLILSHMGATYDIVPTSSARELAIQILQAEGIFEPMERNPLPVKGELCD